MWLQKYHQNQNYIINLLKLIIQLFRDKFNNQIRISSEQNSSNIKLESLEQKVDHQKMNTQTTLKQWQIFSKQLQFSKQTVQGLSKLYIIIHQKVKQSIRKTLLNPNQSTFPQQAQYHIEFIKNILDKIGKAQNDDYLIQVEKEMLRKYQHSLIGLVQQVQLMLKVEDSKANLDFNQLKAIKQDKSTPYDLKHQIQYSKKRLIRSKSGKKTSQAKANPINNMYQVINSQANFMQAFVTKRKAVQQIIQQSISKSKTGLGVSFHKKYQQNNLQKYFNERKQLAQLALFNQNLNLMQSQNKQTLISQQKVSTTNPSQTIEYINQKMFPQFNIKTKFIKPSVKPNILKAIKDVREELIKDYFQENINVLKDANQIERNNDLINRNNDLINRNKNNKNHKTNQTTNNKIKNNMQGYIPRSQSVTTFNSNIHRNSLTSRLNNQVEQSEHNQTSKHNQTSEHKQSSQHKQSSEHKQSSIYKFTQKQTKLSKTNYNSREKSMSKNFSYGNKKQKLGFRSTNDLTNISNGIVRSRKSFINPNPKPFYQTEHWNSKIQQQFKNKFTITLNQAKIQ